MNAKNSAIIRITIFVRRARYLFHSLSKRLIFSRLHSYCPPKLLVTILGLETRIGLAAEELAGAGAADEFAGVNNGFPPRKNRLGSAFDLDAFEHGIVHAHVMSFGADDFFLI